MVEAVLSVHWKNHGCELAAEYRSLLENNFLVDCTLSAEGQSVKAHRLVLSACSPYFHMLFQEETGKHPFVILLNASFETLKAVIDFVYRGETHIPEGNLKAFLTLAQSLQIKGLNAFTQDNKNKNQSSNATENGPQESDETNQITSEVQVIDTSLEMNLENYSQQHRHHTDDYSDAVHTNSSVPVQPFSASCEKVQSTTLMTSLPKHQHLSYDEVSTKTEITVKHEPLCHVFSENTNEILDNVQSHEPRSANFRREMDLITASECGEEDSNRFSSCPKSTCGSGESSLLPSAEQQFVESNNEVSFGGDPVERGDPYHLAGVVPKREHLDDEEGEDPMDDRDMPLTDMTETDEGMEPAYCEQNPGQCSSADGLPLEEDLATQRRSLPGQQSESSPPHTELQLHEAPHAHPGEQTVLSDEGEKTETHKPKASPRKRGRPRKGGIALAHLPSPSTQKPRPTGKKLYNCESCEKTYTHSSNLRRHRRLHAGERSYQCDVCNKRFTQPRYLKNHMRIHTGERPYQCDICSRRFSQSGNLQKHMLCHAGKRPFQCDICSRRFSQSSNLQTHMRCHTGERPYECGVCGMSCSLSSTLVAHMRRHTGDRPYRCDVCENNFFSRSALAYHTRTHTGERPYHCDVCEKSFVSKSSFAYHTRTHTGERLYQCDVCKKNFCSKGQLISHIRYHTRERPYRCDVCGKDFRQKSHLSVHKRKHVPQRPRSVQH